MNDFRETVEAAVGQPQADTIIDRIDTEPAAPQTQDELVSYIGRLLDAGTIAHDEVVAESDEGRVVRLGNIYFLDVTQGLEQIDAEAAQVAEIVGDATEDSSTIPRQQTDRQVTAMLDELEAAASDGRDDQQGDPNV